MMEDLARHLDRPTAWARTYGVVGAIAGAMTGWSGELPGGPFVAAAALGVGAAVFGLVVGFVVRGICRFVGLDRLVRHPEYWAQSARCLACDWRSSPEGPWRVRDCLTIIEHCPSCDGPVVRAVPACPGCGANPLDGRESCSKVAALARVPRSFRQAIWGDYTCRACGCPFDKWGREVVGGVAVNSPVRDTS